MPGFERGSPRVRASRPGPLRQPSHAPLTAFVSNPTPATTLVPMIIPPCFASCLPQSNSTLEPLATLGADALAPAPVHGIKRVVVQELAIGWDNAFQEIVVRRASDVDKFSKGSQS